MALEYKLVSDPSAEKTDQHKAVVVNKKEVTLGEIVDIIMDRGCVGLSQKEMKGIIGSYMATPMDGEEAMTPLQSVMENGVESGTKG
ncbi:hypothetical protein [Fodinibius salsisoli]|uniref:Uncharacterized protein n=1 Tax=Fodinibius salsisoli TaxID=2820877 RepID=A0ABT3PIE1_9BACT|nr:hypothetical protein [Fodinibius salsisoli]MCW9705686.1 hypothetical protein [Fodinibius salsisoli]